MGQHYDQLSAEERGTIMAMKLGHASGRAIARTLGRSPSTIARELCRNGYQPPQACGPLGRPRIAGGYDARRAGQRARRLQRKRRVTRKLHREGGLWRDVHSRLQLRWAPEQIARTLKERYPDQAACRVSHETIYTAIYAMPRGELRRKVIALLRQARGVRRRTRTGPETRGKLPDLPSIHLRPPEANERLLPGHWEGDLIMGAYNRSAVGTLVCRYSLFVMLVKVEDTTAHGVLEGYWRTFTPLPEELRKTLTYDQGKEMALHRKLSELTDLAIYFADPHSPWRCIALL